MISATTAGTMENLLSGLLSSPGVKSRSCQVPECQVPERPRDIRGIGQQNEQPAEVVQGIYQDK